MKKTAAKRVRSHEEKLIDGFLKELADRAIKQSSVAQVAEATQLSEVAVQHMRIFAKGSITSWIQLAMFLFRKSPTDLPSILSKIELALVQQSSASRLQRKIAEALKVYSEDELYAWLELLMARYEIESRVLKNTRR